MEAGPFPPELSLTLKATSSFCLLNPVFSVFPQSSALVGKQLCDGCYWPLLERGPARKIVGQWIFSSLLKNEIIYLEVLYKELDIMQMKSR